ncbi:MAG: hypothetical protein IPJ98_00465 [Bryobacterales bacterium]|nr:hypothetical protein [Bryobacterales bacterium]
MENLFCDFCSAKAPAWCYPAASFIAMTIGPLVSASEGGWAACDECHRLIAADNREDLAQRSLSTLIEAHPEMASVQGELIGSLRDLHARFFAHRCGDAIHVGMPEGATAAAGPTRSATDAD